MCNLWITNKNFQNWDLLYSSKYNCSHVAHLKINIINCKGGISNVRTVYQGQW